MRWCVLTPFTFTPELGWIPAEITSARHSFVTVPATYRHDGSRQTTTGAQWLSYLGHAMRARFGFRDAGYITSFPQLAVCAGLVKRLTGSRAPVLAWCFNMGRTFGGLRGMLARFALRSVDVFVVHSRQEIATYAQWLRIPRERFVFVPLSIELQSGLTERGAEPFLLSMGSANRDYATLFEAVRPLGVRTIVVAGRHVVEGLDIPDCVELRSGLSRQECHALAETAAISVVPIADAAAASGQSTALEAMMFGTCLIATRCVGLEDYVEDGRTGVLVTARDAAGLREAIRCMWADPARRRQIGTNARAFILSSCTFGAVAPQMLQILDRLTPGGDVNRPRVELRAAGG
jgi:hypothetical protein